MSFFSFELDPALAADPVFDLHVRGKMAIAATVPLASRDDLSMAYTPGVARVCEAIAAEPEPGRRLHLDRQHGRRGHRRLRRARPGQHRAEGRDAGDGGQGRAVQAVRRRRRGADLPGHPGRRGAHRDRQGDGALVRRDQPRGHQRAALLRDRAPARRGAGHPGLPRRPARHGRRGARRAAQRGHPARPPLRRPAGGDQRGRRGRGGHHQGADRGRGGRRQRDRLSTRAASSTPSAAT